MLAWICMENWSTAFLQAWNLRSRKPFVIKEGTGLYGLLFGIAHLPIYYSYIIISTWWHFWQSSVQEILATNSGCFQHLVLKLLMWLLLWVFINQLWTNSVSNALQRVWTFLTPFSSITLYIHEVQQRIHFGSTSFKFHHWSQRNRNCSWAVCGFWGALFFCNCGGKLHQLLPGALE